ncbi:MAG TPA: LacI family DNA-binding transcriptional regulator [Chitinophagaceae bacterium]|jgi:LacI family transcriptional regulator|nr:LacI family DNA-binding transcriptional regulator [Chitinophagaceae bacterium]
MKRVSIKDIARKAGVAPSTVSFVLNGKAKEMRISDELAEKVRALVKETGYQPNPNAVGLRTGKTRTLGLIVEDISNVFFAALAKTIEDEAYAQGYRIVYCSTENNDEKGRELIRMLWYQQVEGFLITPSTGMAAEVEALLEGGKPVVLMDRYFTDSTVPYVLVDNRAGISMGVEHLLARGYRKIALVTVDLDQVQMKSREEAYRTCMRREGLEETVLSLSYSIRPEAAVSEIGAFLRQHPDLDAVFFATNYLGVYGLESIKKEHRSIPGDLAVICFDEHDSFRLHTPEITIVRQPIQDIARTAVQLLMQLLDGKTLEEPQVTRMPELVVRAST